MPSLPAIRRLAEQAHEGQVDPDRRPHFEHVLRVADAVDGSEETAVAFLHDVLEDTPVTAEDLRDLGVPPDVVEAVELLTRSDSMSYQSYIERIAHGTSRAAQLARAVKLADLSDNLRRSEAASDLRRAAKYREALSQLEHV
jgi:(p)ppGpp synthase/HD superfamily hydrolase